MFVQPELRNSDYSYNKYGQYNFIASMERALKDASDDVVTAMAGSLERLCVPNLDHRLAEVSNKYPTWRLERDLDFYGSTTVEMPDNNNPYRNLPQYCNRVQAFKSEDALTYEDHNRLPDMFSGAYFGLPSVNSPKAPNNRTLNKRMMSSDSFCSLQAIPSLSLQSVDHQKLRDYSRQSLEDLLALPSLSMYLQKPDCNTVTSIGPMDKEERDCSTAQSIRSLTALGDTEERDVATAMSIVSMREEEGVTTAKAI